MPVPHRCGICLLYTSETFISGLIAGLLMVIPWFLSYFAMMCFYGDTSIVGADVTTPWMEMIKAVNGGPALMALFSLVMGWTLVETATGCIHMIIDRFDVAMEEKGAAKLSDTNRGLITVITLIAALVLSRVGVVTLIEQGYSYLSYGFIPVSYTHLDVYKRQPQSPADSAKSIE